MSSSRFEMAWIRLDDKFHSHPKIVSAGNAGAGLFVRSLSYCSDHLTDGHIPKAWAQTTGGRTLIQKLLAANLWVETENGYQIRNFLELNPSRAEVENLRRQRAEAGRRGGGTQSKPKANRKQTGSKPEANQKQTAKQIGSKLEPQSQSQSHTPFTTGSMPFKDQGIDVAWGRELDRIWARLSDADAGTAGVLMFYARKLPFGSLAKVRESVELQQHKVKSGWVVNALKSELKEKP